MLDLIGALFMDSFRGTAFEKIKDTFIFGILRNHFLLHN